MISAAAESFQIYGEAKPPPAPDRLRAGPLTMEFETTSGFLRRIRLGDIEVLRGIYAAVRDPNWGTVPPELRLTERHVGDDSFYLAFACVHRRQEIDFFWRGVIDGRADGTVLARMPLPDPTRGPRQFTLDAKLPAQSGVHSLCLAYATPVDGPLYAVGHVALQAKP